MSERSYNKLVRDNILEIIRVDGNMPICRELSDDEYVSELRKKLVEETREFLDSGDVVELCDVLEVVDALVGVSGVSAEAFIELRERKARVNGRFERRLYLEKVIERQ